MSTILSAYNLANGDTTSSVFTYSGSSRNLDIEILPTGLRGYSSYCFVETSADNVNWVKTPQSDLPIKESDAVIYHLTQSEGAYVRVKLFRMDSHTGTVTITASEPSGGGGGGDLLAANNLSDVADTTHANHNLGNLHSTYSPAFTPDTGVLGTVTVLHESLFIQVDTEAIWGQMVVSINLDATQSDGTWFFDLPVTPNNNFADDFDLMVNVGYPVNQAPNPAWVFKASAEVGTDLGRLYWLSDTNGDSVILTLQYQYHNQ